jgi:hypothetical protein
VSLVIIEW